MTEPRLNDVAVITVAYRAAAFISSMLEALPLEELWGVLIVDNAAEAALADVVEPFGPRVTVIDAGGNLGFGGGNDLGASRAEGARWLLFLNPDAVLHRPDIENLVRYGERHPAAGIVGPRVYDHGVPLTSGGHEITVATELRHHGPPLLRRVLPERRLAPSYARSGAVAYVEGGCFLMDAALHAHIGGFDPRFFLYYEEADLGRRIRAAGREVHLCAEASVEHRISTTRVVSTSASQVALLRSATRYLEKWHGRTRSRIFAALVVLRILGRTVAGRTDRRSARALVEAVLDRETRTRSA